MRGFRALLLVTLFFALCSGKSAQASVLHRIPVLVSCACQDPGGKAYLEAIRAEIATSAIFREVVKSEGAEANTIRINIVSSSIRSEQMAKTGLKVICSQNGQALLDQEVEICDHYPMKMFALAMLDVLKSV